MFIKFPSGIRKQIGVSLQYTIIPNEYKSKLFSCIIYFQYSQKQKKIN